MKKGPLQERTSSEQAILKPPTRERCFWMKSASCPLPAQVKLLRALQEKEVDPPGSFKPIPFDVRVIAATNRDLLKEMAQGRFRPDLFYRIAVAVLKLPPMKERAGDVGLLIDRILEQINDRERRRTRL